MSTLDDVPEWPLYASRVQDNSHLDSRFVTVETHHNGHKHGAKVVLDLAQAQYDMAYVDDVIDRVIRALRADVESCTS